jgi:hypothetical protein
MLQRKRLSQAPPLPVEIEPVEFPPLPPLMTTNQRLYVKPVIPPRAMRQRPHAATVVVSHPLLLPSTVFHVPCSFALRGAALQRADG